MNLSLKNIDFLGFLTVFSWKFMSHDKIIFCPFFKGKKSKLLTDFTFLFKKENDSFYIPENGKTITRPVLFIDSRLNEIYLGGNDA